MKHKIGHYYKRTYFTGDFLVYQLIAIEGIRYKAKILYDSEKMFTNEIHFLQEVYKNLDKEISEEKVVLEMI